MMPKQFTSGTRKAARSFRPMLAVLVMSTAFVAADALAMRDRIAPNLNGDGVLPLQVQDVGIDDHAGQPIPKGLTFKDEQGNTVALDSYFNAKQPVVLALAYYSCPMLCTVVLNGLTEGLKGVAWTMGNEYRVVTVSIDQRDTPEIAKAKRENYVSEYGRRVSSDSWHFLTGDAENVKKLADALGFRYHWDAGTKQFAHAAGAFILTPDERISRTFYGITFASKDLKLALVEASNGNFSSAVEKLLLFCFHFDPASGKYTVAATRLMAVAGALTVLIVALWMGLSWRRERAANAHA